jgi:hypothetical protein
MMNISDVGVAIESIVLSEFDERVAHEIGVGIDRVWLYRNQLVIDSYPLPHVDSADVVEPSIVATKPGTAGPPLRLWRGKRGRQVTIKGRADTLTEIEAIKALNDGEPHLLILPTGDSFYVLVLDAKPDSAVESWGQIAYSITAKEVSI